MGKTFFFANILFLFCLFFFETLSAQDIYRRNYSGDIENLLQDQATVIFNEAGKVLAAYPPTPNPGIERRLALYSLDALLHDTRLDKGPAFMAYVKTVAGNVAAELSKNKPTGRDVRVFKVYNFGYIVQTASVTIGIDLVRGGKERENLFYIDEAVMRAIVEQCDIHFLTHIHSDHASYSVAKMFYEQGKDMIAPAVFWEDMKPRLRVLRGDQMTRENIPVPSKNTSLDVWVYPGYQGKLENNVYLITLPEGQTIMHVGDQTYYEDLVDKVKAKPVKVDVLLMGCAGNIFLAVLELKPSFVFIGHENEMEHGIDHREPYWLSFRRSNGLCPVLVFAWGEFYTIKEFKF